MKDGRTGADLPARVAARMSARGHLVTGERVVVAVSGGLDSMVLLHLLRFGPGLPRLELVAAHFDHRMRPESREDALWVEGLARAWKVPVEVGGAEVPLISEEAAREARYAFLEAVRARTGARWIMTAHHADDQAETVLFRISRGTGLAGLRGIPARRGVILRPLLSFWREELEAYVRSAGLTPRVDSSNEDRHFARNVLRHDVLPQLEASVAPGVRKALVRLARIAAREERAWRALFAGMAEAAILERSGDRIVLARPVLLGYPSAVGARVLRVLVRRLGSGLDEAGTRAAMEFTRSGTSGRSHSLPGGLVLSREFDRLVLARAVARGSEELLEIGTAGSGEGWFELDGRRVATRWSLDALAPEGLSEHEAFASARLVFPLRFRSWRPGDRIRLPYGSKKLKKVLSEARIPVSGRGQVPVLVDGEERVLWLPGVARASGTEPVSGEETFHIGIRMTVAPDSAVQLGGKELRRIVYTEEQIRERVDALGEEISATYSAEDDLLVLGLLKGSFVFLADLVRRINCPLQVDFLVASSYGAGQVSSGHVRLLYDGEVRMTDRAVVVVEGIVDSGTTVNWLFPLLEQRGPRSLELCALLCKQREVLDRQPRWVGFDAPGEFLVGYGLDSGEDLRHLPYIASL